MPDWKQEVREHIAEARLAPTREAAIIEELGQHLNDYYEELYAGGISQSEAARLTRAELSERGALTRELNQLESYTPEPVVWGTTQRNHMMADLWQDLRYAVRAMSKQPAFAGLVILTLALGIGINAAVYSVADAVLFRPLPFAQPERLVQINQFDPETKFEISSLRWEAFVEWRAKSNLFASVEAYDSRNVVFTGGKEPSDLPVTAVSPGLFPMLGVNPQAGRLFAAIDAEPGNERVIVLSDDFARTNFGKPQEAIGKSLVLNNDPYTVIGVMPPRFKFPHPKQQWIPFVPPTATEKQRATRPLVLARLRPEISQASAQAMLDGMSAQLAKDRPTPRGWNVKLTRLDERRVNPGPRRALWVLLGAVGFVLLLACANAANLLLARAAQRQGEIGVRLALGASRGRLIRQLMTESLLLAGLGGCLGIAMAWWGVDMLAQIVPNELTFLSLNEINLDHRVLWFTLGITLLTGLVFGLLPAWKSSQPDLLNVLKGAGGKASADRKQQHWRAGLVVAEIALSLVLLIGAGLMMRSFLFLNREPLGFDHTNLVATSVALPEKRYATIEQEQAFYQSAMSNLSALPGVAEVSLASAAPPESGGIYFDLHIEVEGRPVKSISAETVMPVNTVDASFFQTLRIPLLQGRSFNAEDTVSAPPVIVINDSLARFYWGTENPVGSRLRLGPEDKWRTVVGVAGDVRTGSPGEKFSPRMVYFPLSQAKRAGSQRTVIVRTAVEPSSLMGTIKSSIWAVDKDLPIRRIETVETLLSDKLAEPRFYLFLLLAFSAFTLLLVTMGIYGVMAYAVTQRTHEIGIRMALGASGSNVMKLILRYGMTLTACGVVIGIAAAFGLSKLMAALLFGVSATDPLTFVVVALFLVFVAALACYVPARRATKVDPMVALRCE